MLATKIDKVDCIVSGEKEIKVNNKGSEHFWNFTLSTKRNMILRNVALINDANRHYFSLASVKQSGQIFHREETLADPSQKIEDIVHTDSLESTPGQQQVNSELL